jgi:hypothetical protein
MAAPVRFERTQCQIQSLMPYRLAMGQDLFNYITFLINFK